MYLTLRRYEYIGRRNCCWYRIGQLESIQNEVSMIWWRYQSSDLMNVYSTPEFYGGTTTEYDQDDITEFH